MAGRHSARWLVPSWLLSLLVHGCLLLALAYTLHRPGSGRGLGIGDGEYVLQFSASSFLLGAPGDGSGLPPGEPEGGSGGQTQGEQASDADGREERAPLKSKFDERELKVDDQPPVALSLPDGAGPGTAPTAAPRAAALSALGGQSGGGTGISGRPGSGGVNGTGLGTGGGGGGRGGNGGGGGTSFFGARANGKRFVYVLDASGSMYEHSAIRVAKAELLASLAQLDIDQQFQVLFYNDRQFPMVAAGGKAQLFQASDINRNLASQFVTGILPDGGTRHMPAILEALNYAPDVIFFLTDAGLPGLYDKELDQIKRRNGGHTQIHAIEFGKFEQLKTDNFLKKLARQNGGTYVYRDITEFEKK